MATLVLEPLSNENPEPVQQSTDRNRWLVFQYLPVTLFSLKNSRATSTAGKTLLTPTPYAIKMAFLDAALRHDLAKNPSELVRWLALADVRIGVPDHACVTGTIQNIRQETRDEDRKHNPEMPPYRSTIAMREVVHFAGTLRIAFDVESCSPELVEFLLRMAPAINYLGKRGSFIQYIGTERLDALDAFFTRPVADANELPAWGHRATLDDFGSRATFAALNSFAPVPIRRNVDRKFVETLVPLGVYNAGPGFVHYSAKPAID